MYKSLTLEEFQEQIKRQEEERLANQRRREKAYAERHPERLKHRGLVKQSQRREKKERMIAYLGGKCVDCGGVFHIAAFDFHHKDPATKKIAFGKSYEYSWEVIQRELDKCELLCANCHRIRHYKDEGE